MASGKKTRRGRFQPGNNYGNRNGRPKGSLNKKTKEQMASDRIDKYLATVTGECGTPQSTKMVKEMVRTTHKQAAKGDHQAKLYMERMHLGMNREVILQQALQRLDVFQELEECGDDLSIPFLIQWGIRNTGYFCLSLESVKLFEDRYKGYFDKVLAREKIIYERIKVSLERDRVELVRQNTMTTEQVHRILKSVISAMRQVLGGSRQMEEMVEVWFDALKKEYPAYGGILRLIDPEQEEDGKEQNDKK